MARFVLVFPQGARAPVPGASVTVRTLDATVVRGTVDCVPDSADSVCRIEVAAGRYDLSVTAPGFETAHRRLEVTPATEQCCPAVTPVKMDVPLTPLTP